MSGWRYQFHRSVPLIPGVLRLNLSRSGVSFTWHLGRLLSWNTRTHDTRINTPGLGSVVHRGRRPRKRRT